MPFGRQRVPVFAALNVITHEVLTVQKLTYITAETGAFLMCSEVLALLSWTSSAGSDQRTPRKGHEIARSARPTSGWRSSPTTRPQRG